MAMSKPQPISVYMVAVTCAALHGIVAIVAAPILACILCWSGPARLEGGFNIEKIMVFAVTAPVISSVFGFIAGGLMATAHNVFAKEQRKVAVMVRERTEVPAAFGSVA
ncbi:MAG TPA: hypothetical protein VKH81_25230 [Candidatus Angelobacter sp.]|nr:hypothetical protein [Candidatus Angelobacter sp.]